ncbi:uncharacterized protein ZBIST_0192 [Zygosaccharomyces bailii]|nr:uncharacterized protein ZBIST_0192 [Zygosaccharomyces bailii]
MAKRLADSQITRETFKEDGSDSDAENGSISNRGKATASVMSKRKIAMPKRKSAGSFNFKGQVNGDESAFKKPPSEGQMPKAFDTLQQNASQNNNNAEANAKLKALNLQFREKVIDTLSKDAFADLRPALDKYRTYIESIKSENKAIPQPVKSVEATVHKGDKSSFEEENEITVEGPKFTLQSKPPTSDSVFSFGIKQQEKISPTESDSEDDIEIKGPQFTFTGEVKSDVFKLDKAAEDKKENASRINPFTSKEAETPPASSAKPAFSFKKPISDNGTPVFTFGQTKSNDEQPKKPSFDFSFKPNTPSTSETGENKSSFSFKFGEQKQLQNSSESNPKSVFSFGASNTKSETAKNSESKPAFSFGAANVSSNTDKSSGAKPAFTFGSSNSSGAPSFSFSKSNNNDTSTTTANAKENSGTSSGGFKFSLPFSQKPASQASPSLPVSTASKGQESKPEESKPEESKPEESKPEETGDEPSKPIEMQNGEENEDSLFSQRCKLMTFNSETKAYDSRGVGELKLLQRKDDKSKVRLLCRSDGMGNILLNTSLVKSFSYLPLTPESENLIKIPVVETEGKLVTYVVKFKQKADGRSLVKSIEDVKKDM